MFDFIVTEMIPQYLNYALHFDLSKAGVISSLPVIVQTTVSLCGSPLTDSIIRLDKWNMNRIRKGFTLLGLMPSLVLIGIIGELGCAASAVVAVLCISYGLTGFASIQRIPAVISVAPRLSGTLHGLVDAVYSCGGFVVPIMCAAMIKGHESDIHYWSNVWYACLAFVATWMLTYIYKWDHLRTYYFCVSQA